MTRQLASSRTVRWLGALSVVFSVATAGLVLRGQEENEDLSPIGILFRRQQREKGKQPPEEPNKGGPPADVPKAPPAQYQQAKQAPPPAAEHTDPLMKHVDEALRLNQRRLLVAESANGKPNSPWQIMHGVLALRQNLELRTPRGTVNAIEWISRDPVFRGDHWFEATRFGGRAHPFSVPYHFEGHVNQFLALLTMSNLPLNHKIGVSGGKGFVTMADMVRHAQMMCNSNEEISWTLWFLTHYLEPDATWTNYNGERWGIEKLVSIQTGQPVVTAPCGGTHGLFALAYARNSYLQKHGKLSGTWLQADQKIQEHIAKARATQNRDGSFSAHFFREPGHTEDPTDRLKTSGHMLEWLMMAVPQQELKQNWVRYGVYRVAADLIQYSNQEIDPGPLYHALHAITLYRERVAPKDAAPPSNAKPSESLAAQRPATAPPVPQPTATKPVPPPAGVEPKVAQVPKDPMPPRPLPTIELKPEAPKTAMLPETRPAPSDPPAVKPAPEKSPETETAAPNSLTIQSPKPLPMPNAAPLPGAANGSETPAPAEPKAGTPPMPTGEPQPIALPQLPGSSGLADIKRPPVPLDKPVGLAATPPSNVPVEPPTTPVVTPAPTAAPVAVAPTLPVFEISKAGTRNAKPENSSTAPPKSTSVTGAKPAVLPPLPLDPVDSPDGSSK